MFIYNDEHTANFARYVDSLNGVEYVTLCAIQPDGGRLPRILAGEFLAGSGPSQKHVDTVNPLGDSNRPNQTPPMCFNTTDIHNEPFDISYVQGHDGYAPYTRFQKEGHASMADETDKREREGVKVNLDDELLEGYDEKNEDIVDDHETSKMLGVSEDEENTSDSDDDHSEEEEEENQAKPSAQKSFDPSAYRRYPDFMFGIPDPPADAPTYKYVPETSADYPQYLNIRVHQYFDDKKALKEAVGKKCIIEGYETKTVRSSPDSLKIICVHKGCGWMMRARKAPYGPSFMVKALVDCHTCSRHQALGTHRQATPLVLGPILRDIMAERSTLLRPKDIMNDMMHMYKVPVTYSQAWRAKTYAVSLLQGSPEESFGLLIFFLTSLTRGLSQLKT